MCLYLSNCNATHFDKFHCPFQKSCIPLQIHFNNGCAVFDAVAVSEAAKHKSKYSYVIFYGVLLQAFSPLISGAVIIDGDDNTNVNGE